MNLTRLIERQMNRWDRIHATLKKHPNEDDAQQPVPQLPVITVSRQAGAGGRTTAQCLAEGLGLELVGYELLNQIARDHELQKEVVDSLDERTRNAVELLVDGLIHGRYLNAEEYAQALAKGIRALATRGGVVFLGRGANYVLREKADLHLRLIAPEDYRIERMTHYEEISEDEARKKIRQQEDERARYIKGMFNADVENAQDYDLTINTSRLAPEALLDVVKCALAARDVQLPSD